MKNNSFKNKSLVIICVVLLTTISQLLTSKTAFAQSPLQSISVSPVIKDLPLLPGKKTTFTITITNNNTTAIGIHAETTGYDITGDSSQFEETPSPLTTWTSLSNSDLLINGKQTKTITATINTPNNIKQNGYYETIFLTPIAHQQEVANSPVIYSRFGILILGTVGKLNYNDLSKKVSVNDITPSFTVLNNFPSTISFSLANNYFTHFDAKPFISITPLFANSQTVQLIDKHVLPGSKRLWHYQPVVAANHIFYQVHLAVSVGGGQQVFSNTWFIVLPYKPLLVSGIILILFYILIMKRKRLKKVLTILMKG